MTSFLKTANFSKTEYMLLQSLPNYVISVYYDLPWLEVKAYHFVINEVVICQALLL